MSSIKQKVGLCIDCTEPTPQPLISKRCHTHYWQYRASLKTPKEPKKREPIKKVSDKMSKLLRAQGALKKVWLQQNPACMAKWECEGAPTDDMHHMEGRGADMNNTSKWLAVCRKCHRRITDDSKEAIERGFSISRNQKPQTES